MFGRWIPVKSNLAYELYQSQCLQADGALTRATFYLHPHGAANKERHEYLTLGETAYLDRKRELFWHAVMAQPLDFVRRVADRFLAATLWYESFDPNTEAPWIRRLSRITHPLPFVALMILAISGTRTPLHRFQWIVIGVYLSYLLPYIGISFYERYALPLLAAEALLVIWGLDRLRPGSGSPGSLSRATAAN
jgi:hypothetical protein